MGSFARNELARLAAAPVCPVPSRRRARPTNTVRDSFTVNLPSLFIESDGGIYDADSGALVEIEVEGRTVDASALEAVAGPAALARLTLDDDRLHELREEVAREEAEGYGDYLYDLRAAE